MQTLVIPVSFVFLAAILLWVTIGSRGRWWIKLSLIVLTLFLGLEMWVSINSYLGWPRDIVSNELGGKRAYLFWTRIDEPSDGEAGGIYFWMRIEEETEPGIFAMDVSKPALFRLPYSRPLHEAAQSFLVEIIKKDGEPVEIGFVAPKGKAQGSGGDRAGELKAKGTPGEKRPGDTETADPRVYLLPPGKLPSKT